MKVMTHRDQLGKFLNSRGLVNRGVEIGVRRGDFSKTILSAWQGSKLYLVDAWREMEDYEDIANEDEKGQVLNLGITLAQVKQFGERAVLIRELSTPASLLFPDESLDFIFIDANHSYDGAMADIRAWYRKVKPQGLVMGHDYLNSTYAENGFAEIQVKRAVNEFMELFEPYRRPQLHVTEEKDFPSWYFFKPAWNSTRPEEPVPSEAEGV